MKLSRSQARELVDRIFDNNEDAVLKVGDMEVELVCQEISLSAEQPSARFISKKGDGK